MAPARERVVAYVDGFNLYHGMHQARGRRGLWLNLESLCAALLRPEQALTHVHYFTALVNGPGRGRQQTYLDALQAHTPRVTVHVGRFQTRTQECRTCGARWTSHEEKESDVSLGVQLVEDAAGGRFDVALLVTADSDMLPAIRSARRLAPETRTLVAFPPRRRSDSLNRAPEIAATFAIGDRVPERHQLPELVPGPAVQLRRPRYWG